MSSGSPELLPKSSLFHLKAHYSKWWFHIFSSFFWMTLLLISLRIKRSNAKAIPRSPPCICPLACSIMDTQCEPIYVQPFTWPNHYDGLKMVAYYFPSFTCLVKCPIFVQIQLPFPVRKTLFVFTSYCNHRIHFSAPL